MLMKKYIVAALTAAAVILTGCCSQERTPRAKHVIFLGFDAMSSIGIQRAETPNFNYMIENGAVSLDTRCVRPTSSSQNWMSMVSGAPIEVHGVYDNDWEPDGITIEPAVTNAKGLFPTMFDDIRAGMPDARMYSYVEWTGEVRMYDMSVFDKSVVSGIDGEYNADQLLEMAFADYLADEPEFMFVSIDLPDHEGHVHGHDSQAYWDCLNHMDALVGGFVKELEARGMMDDAVIMIAADHGGILYGHGGDSMEELKVPIIMYGKGVTKGKVMESTNMIYDNAVTVCGLLGVDMPRACRGKFLYEAFEPKTDVCYVPTPLIRPFKGVVGEGETVTITADAEGVEIYYTLDGTVPTLESTKYTGPFGLSESCTVQAVAYRNGNRSGVASNFLYSSVLTGEPSVGYKLYRNFNRQQLPDFTKFGRPDAQGFVSFFSLDEIPVADGEDHFAVIFHSTLMVKEAGKYTFELSSDDGSKLYIDGDCIINNDGSHSRMSRSAVADLTQGDHLVKVEYFDDTDGQSVELRWAPAGKAPRPIFPQELKR